ncbi:MAG: cytochrome c biogenesis protein CcdA [Anaerolineae bacterium]|nr:cytochrome c biogenesis protein CcdA [Anaerolineae bacterium]
MEITVWLAFAAGLVSFISPCVLPLVPAYVGYMGGQTTHAAGQGRARRFDVLIHGVFFVLGFSVVFVLLGVAAGVVGDILRSDAVAYVGGAFIILFGLHIMGVFRALYTRLSPTWQARLQPLYAALYADTRAQIRQRPGLGYAGSSLLGLVFAAGWSPCIGPILGSVLLLAGSEGGDPARGGLLLFAYSLGLGIPFLVMAGALDRMTGFLRRLQRHMRTVEIVSGALLIVIGVLVFTGTLQQLSQIGSSADIAYILEECVVGRWLGARSPLTRSGRAPTNSAWCFRGRWPRRRPPARSGARSPTAARSIGN